MRIRSTIKRSSFAPLFLILLLLATFSSSCVAMSFLSGKRVLVTGAGRGIGRAIALILSQQGAHVAIASRTRSELQDTAALALAAAATSTSDNDKCHRPMQIHVVDLTNPTDVERMVQSIVDQWGGAGLDILINNAGGSQPQKGPVDTIDSEDLARLLQLNVVGVHLVTSTVLKHAMPKDGKIINISSKAGKVGLENYSAYVASKFALEGMTSCWAKELVDRNIQVNSISPGMVNTQSFPKPEGKAGVRSAEAVKDGLMVLLNSSLTGHYLHVDELDQARAAKMPDETAMKPIDEPQFDPSRKI
jgi:NAD(P)-dependent dehydrogenase (short-subunit alcohol dehydrogenase family)